MTGSVGFIGLGQMGSRMATNLAKKLKTRNLLVFDKNTTTMNRFATAMEQAKEGYGHNVRYAKDPAHIARSCSVIFTMLPSGKIVEDVHMSSDGTLSGGFKKNASVIDCSTIAKDDHLSIRNQLHERSKVPIRTYDAPVSGGTLGAEKGTLTFMVGADTKSDVDHIEPILRNMGTNVFHCGSPGAGQVAKVCNNLILCVSMIAVTEAMTLGVKEGLDPKQLNEIFSKCTGQSWITNCYNPVPNVHPNAPASKGYEGGFATSLVIKDLSLAVDLAKSRGVLPTISLFARDFYRMAQKMQNTGLEEGHVDKDFSYIYEYLKSGMK